MSPTVLHDHRDGVLSITLNRPDIGNLVTADMIITLTGALHLVTDQTRLVVLRGAGNDFCSGRDYQVAPEDVLDGVAPSALEIGQRMTAPILALYGAVKELPVPTLAVVRGGAHGFGCALACSCDIVLAAENARFSLPEMRERGMPPTLAMTALIDRISYRSLAYLVYSTVELDSASAMSAGLTTVVCPDEVLDANAAEIITTICAIPQDTSRVVKRYLRMAPAMSPQARAKLGSNLYAIVASSRRATTPDASQGQS